MASPPAVFCNAHPEAVIFGMAGWPQYRHPVGPATSPRAEFSHGRDRRLTSTALPSSGIDLWIWSLDPDTATLRHYENLLSAEERRRAGRFVFPVLAQRFIAAHGRMRELLGGYLGQDPASLGFLTNAYGKPELIEGQAHFSLSHSGDRAALAVAAFPLGLDIEIMRPVSRDLPERYFSPAERDGLRGLDEVPWREAFFRCWTRKEAVIKALGLGLAFPLGDFDVTFLADAPARLTRIAGAPSTAADWHLHHVDIAADCVGAIAAARTGWTVVRHE